MWLESLSPWQAVLLPDSPHVPAGQRLDRTEQGEPTGDRYYAWPSQFCCDWLDMAYLEPCLKELEPGQGILGRLWADMVRLRPGVSGNLSSVRWFGGAFAGVVCDASTGAVASEVVTGTSGTDTVSGTTDGAGFYDIGGANDESYSVAHDSDTASLSGRVWRRASFPD